LGWLVNTSTSAGTYLPGFTSLMMFHVSKRLVDLSRYFCNFLQFSLLGIYDFCGVGPFCKFQEYLIPLGVSQELGGWRHFCA